MRKKENKHEFSIARFAALLPNLLAKNGAQVLRERKRPGERGALQVVKAGLRYRSTGQATARAENGPTQKRKKSTAEPAAINNEIQKGPKGAY